MSRSPEVATLVGNLVGTWTGSGHGEYPTIDSFDYREVTSFTARDDHPSLHYEQRTWRATPDGEVVSHWETGLLRISSDGSVLINNAQGGRAESLIGTWGMNGSGWALDLTSKSFAGDERVVEARRNIHLNVESLTYDMYMHTTTTDHLLLHLTARLTRET
ncbi:MAG: FABP family protein [Acidimicrobiia bacterium]